MRCSAPACGRLAAIGVLASATFVPFARAQPGPPPYPFSNVAVFPTAVAIGPAGGVVQIKIFIEPPFSGGWHAESQADWLVIASPAAGSWDGAFQLSVLPNSGSQRVGSVLVYGKDNSRSVVVTQTGAGVDTNQPQVVNPAAGAADVTAPLVITWTTVPGAQAYYLYVGTGPGAKDVVDSHETQQTEYTVVSLPSARQLYARVFAKVDGVWHFTEIAFRTAAAAYLLLPTDGKGDVPFATAFGWTHVSDAQAYYLYVGTTPGAHDVIDTGETLETSLLPGLPAAMTLYARLFTRVRGEWLFTDSTFSTQGPSMFVVPSPGATDVDNQQPFTWTSISAREAYSLYVGTTPGGKDIVDSGEIKGTSWTLPPLPAGRTLHARIHTRLYGVWYHSDVTFTTATRAGWIYPASDDAAVGLVHPFEWREVSDAMAYYLYVGTAPGLHDVVDTGEIASTSYAVSALPADATLYATIWTLVPGKGWLPEPVRFTTPRTAVFLTPPTIDVVLASPTLKWTGVSDAEAYYLYVGTGGGAKDVVDTGEISGTSYTAASLPTGQLLYARIWTKWHGVWRFDETRFWYQP